ncbi:MAG: phage holin [Bacillota bacterium]|uniref:phage holin n=1 Tax=Cytobacillus firmus TaxID=1399 RepID=UPI0018CDB5A8|nr:phage holin [Cytobacillus firmus]MBG9603530.1 hypothetical protein [Cytobacillus firmus]MBG9655044.1 hypothetical protein [Cytobacillus firmus]MDD9312627.1 phage holin [Cytobacillus firmus]MED1908875.1 phage holin [Cytobacillus firmus]
MNRDVVSQVVGFLTAIMLFLGTINIKFEWFNEESISAFGIVLSAGIMLAVTLYTIYKNHFGFTDKAKKQKAFLEKEKLK